MDKLFEVLGRIIDQATDLEQMERLMEKAIRILELVAKIKGAA